MGTATLAQSSVDPSASKGITMISMFKQAALAVCFVASVGAIPLAHADSFGVSVGTGPSYGYYNRPVYAPQRCFRNYYGAVVCRRARPAVYPANYYGGASYYSAPAYYNNGYYNGYNGYNYGSGISLNYSSGWNHRDNDRRDRDDDNRWQH